MFAINKYIDIVIGVTQCPVEEEEKFKVFHIIVNRYVEIRQFQNT